MTPRYQACGAILIILSSAIFTASSSSQENTPRPSGVLAGRVVDDEGRPMRGMQVQALVLSYADGRRQMSPRGNPATTNDRGEFRLFWLEPDSYYVEVNPSPPKPDLFRLQPNRLGYIPADPESSFVTTYFPGTPHIDEAQSVQVGPGDTDIRAIPLAAVATRVIRGRIRNTKWTEADPILMTVALRQLNMSYASTYPLSALRPAANGEFEIRAGITAGQYRLIAGARTLDAVYAGSATVTVGITDPDLVDIELSKVISVQGQVHVEGAAADAPPRSLSVTCDPDPSLSSGMSSSSPVRSNGRFILENILPERYSVHVNGLTRTEYLDSITVEGEEMSPAAIDFPADVDSVSMTVRIKGDGGSVSGLVVDERRTALAGAAVVLVPAPEFRTRPDLFKSATTNNQGEFQISGVPPGGYTALAFARIDPGAFQDASFLNDVETRGTPLTVDSGGQVDLRLTWIHKP